MTRAGTRTSTSPAPLEDTTHTTDSAFALPDHLAAKADPALVAADEQHFAALAACLDETVAELSDRLDTVRRAPGGAGQEAMDRDLEVHRLTARLRTLRRFGLDLCLGHMVRADDPEPVYVGRLGLTDRTGRRLLVDWRSPAAEPFFGATHADPMGLVSRRRYRWGDRRVRDYWDEVFTPDAYEGHAAALDDQSAFLASLGGARSERMPDVLATIQADQDAVIRAGSAGTLVVDGGPGTGKTVVALHRAAYLLHADPRLGHRRGGVLFVGPHEPYLAYVGDVLPSLGEEGVRTCTLAHLVPEGAAAAPEADPEVARLKADARLVAAVEPAVRLYEKPPTDGMLVETPWADVWVAPRDWAAAFDAAGPDTPHNEARDVVWEALLGSLVDKCRDALGEDEDDPDDRHRDGGDSDDGDADFDAYGLAREDPDAPLRRALAASPDLVRAFGRAWPLLEPTDVVGDLWSVPAYLRMCAPWLAREDVARLQRDDPYAWTVADLPVLDAARRRLGDPDAPRRHRRREAVQEAERTQRAAVSEQLVASDDSDLGVMSMLRGQDLRAALVDDGEAVADPDRLAGPFAHVVVDEAQELTDAEWQMLLARCPSRSLTVVGDRAQARHGFPESWEERLGRVGLDRVRHASLRVNYRTPEEVMAEAEPVIRAALPDANVPTSVRRTGVPVVRASRADLQPILDDWLDAHAEGTACVLGDAAFRATARVRSLTPAMAKGLEFDLVVLVDPAALGDDIEGAVDRYVAMTRATQRLVVLTREDVLTRDDAGVSAGARAP